MENVLVIICLAFPTKTSKWTNPQIIPYGPLSLNPGTHVFHYGQSIFEGMKAYKNDKGQTLLFRPIENLNRLNRSAERLCMPKIDQDIFMQGLTNLLEIDKDWIHSIRHKIIICSSIYDCQ